MHLHARNLIQSAAAFTRYPSVRNEHQRGYPPIHDKYIAALTTCAHLAIQSESWRIDSSLSASCTKGATLPTMIRDSTDHAYTTSRFKVRVSSCSLRMVRDWLSSSAHSDTTDDTSSQLDPRRCSSLFNRYGSQGLICRPVRTPHTDIHKL